MTNMHWNLVWRMNKKGVVTADTLTNGGIQKSNFINESKERRDKYGNR